MKTNIIFSLVLDNTKQNKVELHLEDPECNVPMGDPRYNKALKANVFEVPIPLSDRCQIPKRLSYNYKVNGSLLYPTNQTLVISKRPLSTRIYVNDSKIPQNQQTSLYTGTTLTINFNISNPKLDNKHHFVYLVSDMNGVFIGPSGQMVPMIFNKSIDQWSGSAQISVFLNTPIVYKYTVFDQPIHIKPGREVFRENGRPHTLFINSPLANKNILVYDTWSQGIPYFSYYPHLVKPSEVSSIATSLKIEFTSWDPINTRNVFLKGNNSTLSKPENMFPDGSWRRDIFVPLDDVNCNFNIGLVTNSDSGIVWNQNPSFIINKKSIINDKKSPAPLHQDVVASNLFFGEAYHRIFGVFVPLCSIIINCDQFVGDFTSLKLLAKWCKQCGIYILHVHIEQIEGGLIDPVHSNVLPNDPSLSLLNDVSNLLTKIRDAKLGVLWAQYSKWKSELVSSVPDQEFALFVATHQKVARKCGDEFSLYVQYTLFKDFADAFATIVDNGIQLITDVKASLELMEDITQFAHYSQGIRVIGLSSFFPNEVLTFTKIHEIFGGLSDFVINTFCMKDDRFAAKDPSNNNNNNNNYNNNNSNNNVIYKLTQSAYSPEFIKSIENYFIGNDPDFILKLEQMKAIFEQTEKSRFFTDTLQRIAHDCPASIFIDAPATISFQAEQIEAMNLIPCVQQKTATSQNVKVALMPNFLTPEMISEFTEGSSQQKTLEEIRARAKSLEKCVVVYLYDLLAAMQFRMPHRPVQLIEGHCRYQFTMTVEDLMQSQELNQSIQTFLCNCNRLM